MADYVDMMNGILGNWGWLIIIGILFLFALGILIILAFLWYKGKIPIFKKYPLKYILRESRDQRLMPVRIGKARAYKTDTGTLWALKTGFMSEISGIPAPTYEQLYANDWAEFVMLDRELIYPVINRHGANIIKDGQIIPLDNTIEGKLEIDQDETKRRLAWKDAERHRMERQKQEAVWLQALPYAAIIVSMVGCFLIIAMLATPITTTMQSATATMNGYRDANEYLYKAVQISKAGTNGTIPLVNPDQPPPG